jgi:hypothetical protein
VNDKSRIIGTFLTLYQWFTDFGTDPEWQGIEETHLRVMRVLLSPHEGTAEVKEVARHAVDYQPSHVDVAGEHVVLVEQIPATELGNIRLFNWNRMEFVELPEVCP